DEHSQYYPFRWAARRALDQKSNGIPLRDIEEEFISNLASQTSVLAKRQHSPGVDVFESERVNLLPEEIAILDHLAKKLNILIRNRINQKRHKGTTQLT